MEPIHAHEQILDDRDEAQNDRNQENEIVAQSYHAQDNRNKAQSHQDQDSEHDGVGHQDQDISNETKSHATQRHPLLPSEPSNKTSQAGYWSHSRAFVTIIATFVLGVALALGHHFMNSRLDGTPVESISVSQSWIFRFGTGFAFLVSMAFGLSVAAAYIQYQWLRLRGHSFRVDEIDSLTDVLGNALHFFYSLVFFRQPVLFLMALIAWTIPFAAVVTPGSLTVTPARNVSTISSHVPYPLFNTTLFGNISMDGSGLYANPLLYKLAFSAASTGQPMSISSESQNETYTLTFDGPAVRCAPAEEALARSLTRAYGDSRLTSVDENVMQFFSWVPQYGGKPPNELLGQKANNAYFTTTLDNTLTDVARIFVMSNTGSWNRTIGRYNTASNTTLPYIRVNVTECQLYNATYNVDFTFQYPNQTRQVSISRWLNPITPQLGLWTYFDGVDHNTPNATAYSGLAYLSLMQAYGKLLVGYAPQNIYGTLPPVYTSWQIIDIDWSRGPAVQSGLESLFQNMTLSLLGDSQFVKPRLETEPVPITVTTYPNTYNYAAYELLIAYGLALIFALLCAVIGTYAFFANGASYQNLFSSFLRATAGQAVHTAQDFDGSGADPVPRELAMSRIVMGASMEKSG